MKGDTTHKVFAVNAENRVLYPPQYHVVQRDVSWALLENDAKERLLLFTETEKSLPFAYKKQILWASGDCLLGVLKPERKWHFDIVNFKTQERYQTITHGAVAIDAKSGTYFVKTEGREIIAPMSLENDTYNLVDSLTQAVERFKKTSNHDFNRHPIDYPEIINLQRIQRTEPTPDNLNLPKALRNQVWHYLLQTLLESDIHQADSKDIVRAQTFKHYDVYESVYHRSQTPRKLRYLFADSAHISFTLILDSAAQSLFKNYIHTKKGWAAQELSDILNLSRDNTIKINDLLREKLKKLEDKEIDCGESASFVERTQNAFLVHAKGISFYFSSNKYDSSSDDNTSFHYVPILLTWGELKGVRRF